ncbi:MAG: sulfur carrier protein ThiS [Phycisphaeraceae bacterium]|nr:sulfur carrier protein ThiS [Phycisphaeraceae bacterium]
MKLLINGKESEFADVRTVADLLKALELEKGAVAVELNREVVPRADHLRTTLHEGDQLEVVTLVGGG